MLWPNFLGYKRWFVLSSCWTAMLGTSAVTYAATIEVTTTDDEIEIDGACSLRQAIEAANLDQPVDVCAAGSGADVIEVPAGIYLITLGSDEDGDDDENEIMDLDIKKPLTIRGADGGSIIDGNGSSRVFDILTDGVFLERMTIRGGFSLESAGSAIRLQGELVIDGCTLTENADSVIDLNGRALTLLNTTVSNNEGSFLSDPGPIFPEWKPTKIEIYNSTIVENDDIYEFRYSEIEITGSIFTDFFPEYNGACSIDSGGYNIVGDTTCLQMMQAGDMIGFDPELAPLANNGGPTLTHALFPQSPAIEAGICAESEDGNVIHIDQRGQPRQGCSCDIGAYESAVIHGTPLFQVTDEIAGAHCSTHGLRVDSGLDCNGDGVLQEHEIQHSSYVCDGESGVQLLINVNEVEPGEQCGAGGRKIDIGLDFDGDGSLDAEEITESFYTCNGTAQNHAALIETAEEAPGSHCQYGGIRVDTGSDTNDNGILEPDEISGTAYICDEAPEMPETGDEWPEEFRVGGAGCSAVVTPELTVGVLALCIIALVCVCYPTRRRSK